MSLVQKIKDGVAEISYNDEVRKAQSALLKLSEQSVLDEDTYCTNMIDLPAENFSEYTEHVTESMGLNYINKQKVLDAWESVHQFGGFQITTVKEASKYGPQQLHKFVTVILAAKKKSNGTYDLAYSTHKVEAWDLNIAPDEYKAITESYGPYKCMLELRGKALC